MLDTDRLSDRLSDRLIQGMAEGGDFRIIAAQTTETVETARALLDLAPVATDALGRAPTGSLLLARLLDKHVKHQYVTLRFQGNGPLGVVIAEGKATGGVRGWVENPVPTDSSLDVKRAIGGGMLTIVPRTPPLPPPHTSPVPLTRSRGAREITHHPTPPRPNPPP